MQVLKRDGSTEEFDRTKLLHAIRTACAKRPVSMTEIETIADGIEDRITREAGVEVQSSMIGELVMDGLKPLDRVAYVRFASVYRNFQDVDEFQEFVDEMNERGRRELQQKHQAEFPF